MRNLFVLIPGLLVLTMSAPVAAQDVYVPGHYRGDGAYVQAPTFCIAQEKEKQNDIQRLR